MIGALSVRLDRGEPLNSISGVETDCLGKSQKLNNVHLSLASFDRGNERLVSTELLRDLGLSQSRLLPFFNQEVLQGLMS